jgi:hypothetical protein
MRFAGINFDSDLPQGNQQRLDGIYAASLAPSRVVRPANFVLTLPMISHVDRDMNLNRDVGRAAFGIDLKRSFQDNYGQPLQEAALRHAATWKHFLTIRGAPPYTVRLFSLRVRHNLFRRPYSLKGAPPCREPLPPFAS